MYFSDYPSNDGAGRAACNLCSTVVKTAKWNSSMYRHLCRAHPIKYERLRKYADEIKSLLFKIMLCQAFFQIYKRFTENEQILVK